MCVWWYAFGEDDAFEERAISPTPDTLRRISSFDGQEQPRHVRAWRLAYSSFMQVSRRGNHPPSASSRGCPSVLMSLFAYYRRHFLQVLFTEKISASRTFTLSLQSRLPFWGCLPCSMPRLSASLWSFFPEISLSFPPFFLLQRSWLSLLSYQRPGTARLMFHFWSVYLTHPAFRKLWPICRL